MIPTPSNHLVKQHRAMSPMLRIARVIGATMAVFNIPIYFSLRNVLPWHGALQLAQIGVGTLCFLLITIVDKRGSRRT